MERLRRDDGEQEIVRCSEASDSRRKFHGGKMRSGTESHRTF